MPFKPFTAADYRSLDHDAFVARKQEVMNLLNAEELPEGVTDEMLYAEADLIEADAQRRSRANKLFNSKVEAVANGAGNVIATTEATEETETRTMPKPEAPVSAFQARNRELSQKFTDSVEYREAFAKHLLHQAPMPSHMIAKAVQERANTTVSMNESFTNLTDPTFSNTISSLIVAPSTLSDVVQKEMREVAVLFPKVNQTSYQGQYAVSELDLMLTGAWIGDKEVSPYQDEYDPEVFTWGWHQFEARHARTMLAQAIMDSRYDQVGEALGECFARAADEAVYAGNGVNQPRGITKDLRLLGSDGKGVDSDLTTWYTQRTGTGKGRAVIVEVTQADIDDWRFWVSLLYDRRFNRLYRGKGDLIMSDSLWGNHLAILRDDNNNAIGRVNPLGEQAQLSIVGIGNVDTLPNYVMPDFETAEAGDIIGVYGNLKGYTMNTQPGMPLSTVSWTDHETNTIKTKMLVAMDGRVHDPFGWLFLVKAEEG